MSQFWDLMKQSVITQAIITIIVIVTYCYMLVAGRPVPPDFLAIVTLIVGVYFGSKIGYNQGYNAASSVAKGH